MRERGEGGKKDNTSRRLYYLFVYDNYFASCLTPCRWFVYRASGITGSTSRFLTIPPQNVDWFYITARGKNQFMMNYKFEAPFPGGCTPGSLGETGTEIKKRQGREGDRERQSETERESQRETERDRESKRQREMVRLYFVDINII